jgi:SAM-dependent methyltransferase
MEENVPPRRFTATVQQAPSTAGPGVALATSRHLTGRTTVQSRYRASLAAFALSAFTLSACVAQPTVQQAPSSQADFKPQSGQSGKDVIWVPTPQALVDRMLDMAALTKDDYVIDLGSGDGRTVITAAKRGARAHGIEYNPDMVVLAQRAAEAEGVAGRATFAQADIFESDFSSASLITLFLLPNLNVKLRPALLDMRPGTRVVSNSFSMGEWQPDDTIEAGAGCVSWCRAHKWIVPAKVDGTWKLGDGSLELTQTFQMLDGTLTMGGKTLPISEARMNGSAIGFTAGGRRYSGQVDGSSMTGSLEGGGQWRASRAA